MQADNPIACTLGVDALGGRLDWIRGVTQRHLLSHILDGAVLRLTYSPGVKTDLEQIVARERECCSFLVYSLEAWPEHVRLTIEAPDGVGAEARWLFEQFMPRAEPTSVRRPCGCAPGRCG